VEVYDSDCDIKFKQFKVKKSDNWPQIDDCENEACIAKLLSIPMDALVVGSIVVVGNTVFWLEKEGKCLVKQKDNKNQQPLQN
jgi:hypothetical protein